MTDQPKRIQRQRTKGWQMPEGAIYVGRPSWASNPFKAPNAIEVGYLHRDDPDFVIRQFLTTCFKDWLTWPGSDRDWWHGPESDERRAVILRRLGELRGHDLSCWCPLNHDCHADVLLELANG
jgi:hypothetical protein